MNEYLQAPISNGNPIEQALIRRWWHEHHQGRGLLVWEYYLKVGYADAIWFPKSTQSGEVPGRKTSALYPLAGDEVVLLEAKAGKLSHGLIGQALVYNGLARSAGAIIREVLIFAQYGSDTIISAARELGLSVEVRPL
jgi:hypothetical protein